MRARLSADGRGPQAAWRGAVEMGPACRRDCRTHGASRGERAVKLSALLPSGRRRREEELDEELAAHLRMAEAARVARGEAPADGAANARREFGNMGLIKQITRAMWGRLRHEQ